METMANAWIFTAVGKKLEQTEITLPTLNEGEILVKNECCTICKSDLHTFSGARLGPTPSILGHEILGKVVELPVNPVYDFWNNKLEIGDLITWTIMASCGKCFYCERGIPQKCLSLKKYGHEKIEQHFKLTGGFASHTHLFPGTFVFKLPNAIDKKLLAGLNCSWATVMAAMRLAGNIEGKNVLITGAGMLGILATTMCKENGAGNIIVCEKDSHRLQLAKKFGADFLISDCKQNRSVKHKISEFLNNQPVDIILEMTGVNEIIEFLFDLAGVGVTVVLAGSVLPVDDIKINPEKIVRNLWQIKGIHNYTPNDLANAIQFLSDIHLKYPWELLFDENDFDLQSVDKAVSHALSGSMHRVVINYQ